jgi:hypothetical protein
MKLREVPDRVPPDLPAALAMPPGVLSALAACQPGLWWCGLVAAVFAVLGLGGQIWLSRRRQRRREREHDAALTAWVDDGVAAELLRRAEMDDPIADADRNTFRPDTRESP